MVHYPYSSMTEEAKERKRLRSRKWKQDNKLRRAIYQLKVKYNLTWDNFMALIEEQNYCCAICGISLDLPGNEMNVNDTAHVDHCHTTNKIRGLLCKNCNRALGFFKDDISLLQKAIVYLKGNSNGC